MDELDIEKERELLRKMMEHSKAEQERKLEAARLKAEAEDAAWWQAKLDAQKVYDDNLCKEILMEDERAKLERHKAIREALNLGGVRVVDKTKQREAHPDWGGFS